MKKIFTIAEYNKRMREVQVRKEMINAIRNYDLLCNSDVTLVPIGHPDIQSESCIVCGSGSSLNDILPILRDWTHPVYCTASQLSTLEYWGVNPMNVYCMCLDAGTPLSQFEAGTVEYQKDCTLMVHPGTPTEVIKYWPGDMEIFRVADLNTPEYTYIRDAYDFIGTEILTFGSSVPALIELARIAGHSPIFLAGCDFSDQRFDFKAWINNTWKTEKAERKDNPIQEHYMKSCLMSILITEAPVVNMGVQGTNDKLFGIASWTAERVIRSQGSSYAIFDYNALGPLIEKYLVKSGIHLCRATDPTGTVSRKTWVTANNLVELLSYLKNRGYREQDVKDTITNYQYLTGDRVDSPYYKEV